MTPTERAKRSDALYYETVSVTRRVLCDMIANRESDIDELQNRIERLERNRGRLIGESYRLGTENAKLRELVEDMHAALQAFCDAQDVHGDNCPLWVERTDDCELRGIERRMRELGVDE